MQKSKAVPKIVWMLALLLLLTQREALACSCVPPRGIDYDYRTATLVFMGDVISSKRSPYFDSTIGRYQPWLWGAEEVLFKVKKSWKGATPGAVIKFRTELDTCALNVSDDPPFVAEKNGGRPYKTGKTWLIYSYSRRELNRCTRTLPINFTPKQTDIEIKILDRIAIRQKKK